MSAFSLQDIFLNLLLAARYTIVLSLVAFAGGVVLGLLVLLMRISRSLLIRTVAIAFTGLFQGTPLLMQMFLMFFGLALFGYDVPAWLAACMALILWSAAFLSDIWVGCVRSIATGQWEASSSLAMGHLMKMRYIILPQALRIALAPTVGFSVQIVKSTAIASIVGFAELSKTGVAIMNSTFKPLTVYALIAVIYFLMCWLLSLASSLLERKFNASH